MQWMASYRARDLYVARLLELLQSDCENTPFFLPSMAQNLMLPILLAYKLRPSTTRDISPHFVQSAFNSLGSILPSVTVLCSASTYPGD
jgi:hypothetical protein